MRTEAEICQKGMVALLKEPGDVDAEIFIRNLVCELFDYTDWQKKLWMDKSVQELSTKADEAVKEHKQ